MSYSQSMFQSLCDFQLISGLFSYQPLTGWKSACFKIYICFTLIIMSYGLACIIYSALNVGKIPYFLILAGLVIWVLFDTIYFYLAEEKVRKLLKKIEKLKDMFENNSFEKGGFSKLNMNYTMKIQRYMLCYIIMQATLPIINGNSKLVRVLGLFGMDGQVTYIVPSIYDIDFSQHPFLYTLDLYFQIILFIYVCLKQATTECFFTCLFLHMTLCFDHLHANVAKIYSPFANISTRSTLKYIRLRDNIDDLLEIDSRLLQLGVGSFEPPKNILELEKAIHMKDERNIKTWAKMHQELLNVSRELIQLYNPVLLVQFGMMFFLFVVLAFTLSMQTHKKTLDDVEITIIGSYWVMIMTVFFIMCLTGNELNRYSSRVFEPAISIPWYSSSKAACRSILVIGERCRKPLKISLYCSEIFHLSTATFVWIMKSVLTVLIALMQMQRRQHGSASMELKA